MKMTTEFLLLCLIAAVSAGNVGYNYKNSEPGVSESKHQSVHTPQTHDDGYHKQYYYFNAPEEHVDHHGEILKKAATHTKKNLQVIFIKPPEEKVHKKPIVNNVAHNVVGEETHIYVLSKEPNHAAAAKKAQTIQQASVHHHKPDIQYIKYHTPAEAQQIQESIIQQYGGKPSDIVHINSAPIANFAGTSSKDHHHGSPSVSREYLAPKPSTTSEIVHSNSAPVVNFASTSSGDHHHASPSVSREYLAPNP